ncbi:MAG: Bax inhibitor-1/YccA family protein [Alphaproteobacteria bacterium]|nr:Bax inhibitor-1/YccA family protein [Alphaproteobacteria bacterium]
MAEPTNNRWGVTTDTRAQTQDIAIDQGLRSYMLRVYNYMGSGLALSGIVAYLAATTGLWQAIAATPLKWVVMLAPLGMLFLVAARLERMSAFSTQAFYWAFVAVDGLSLGYIFHAYTATSIAKVFFITAAMFGSVSLWGYVTKADLSKYAGFLIMGAVGLIIAGLVNLILESAMMSFVISVVTVLVFTGFTAYSTQQIRQSYDYVGHDATWVTKGAVFGALNLYILFMGLFQALLSLFGNRE